MAAAAAMHYPIPERLNVAIFLATLPAAWRLLWLSSRESIARELLAPGLLNCIQSSPKSRLLYLVTRLDVGDPFIAQTFDDLLTFNPHIHFLRPRSRNIRGQLDISLTS